MREIAKQMRRIQTHDPEAWSHFKDEKDFYSDHPHKLSLADLTMEFWDLLPCTGLERISTFYSSLIIAWTTKKQFHAVHTSTCLNHAMFKRRLYIVVPEVYIFMLRRGILVHALFFCTALTILFKQMPIFKRREKNK